MTVEFSRQIQISLISIHCEPCCSIWTHVLADMTKIIVVFRNSTNAPNKSEISKLSLSVFINIVNNMCPVYYLPYNEMTHFEIGVYFCCNDGGGKFLRHGTRLHGVTYHVPCILQSVMLHNLCSWYGVLQ